MRNEYLRLGSVVAEKKMDKETAWKNSEKVLLEAARRMAQGDFQEPSGVSGGSWRLSVCMCIVSRLCFIMKKPKTQRIRSISCQNDHIVFLKSSNQHT